jgi:hypothetical protein
MYQLMPLSCQGCKLREVIAKHPSRADPVGDHVDMRFQEFFTVNIRNPDTRRT